MAKDDYQEPVLVSSTDGVGTKIKLAFETGKHDSVGIDLVAMVVNDLIVSGARPLFFLDYLACHKVEPDLIEQVLSGVAMGCREACCVLIGGETAEMNDLYGEGEYDLAGFGVGVVDKKAIIDGKSINVGDQIIGLSSSGVHSNGFSLVRRIEHGIDPVKLLAPTKIYVKEILALIDQFKGKIKGLVHITGGGLPGNIVRILPSGVSAVIKKDSWQVPDLFLTLQAKGNVIEEEMFRVFNMGIGMVLIVDPSIADQVLAASNEDRFLLGEIKEGQREVVIQ